MKSAEGRRSIYSNTASVRDEGVERWPGIPKVAIEAGAGEGIDSFHHPVDIHL